MTSFDLFCGIGFVLAVLVALFQQGVKVGRRRERRDMAMVPNVQPPVYQSGMLTADQIVTHKGKPSNTRPPSWLFVDRPLHRAPPPRHWLPS